MIIIRAAALLAGLTSLACVFADKATASVVFMSIALLLWLVTYWKEQDADV